jgi:uncharacterized protein (TIGR03083 family)
VGSLSVRALLADERADLVAFLGTLDADEWNTPSLCVGWRVRDVVAHLLYDSDPVYRYLAGAVATGFSLRRAAARSVRRADRMEPAELTAALQRSVGRGLFATIAPSVALADALIHHQDLRRPLGRSRVIDQDRVLHVLDHPDPFASPRRRTRGLRFTATDVSWSRGDGPEVRGSAEAVIMAVAGRAAVLGELSGDGVGLLRTRLAQPVATT